MSQQQNIIRGDSFQKLTSTGMIVGAVLLIVFNVLVPRPSDPGNMQSAIINTVDNFFLFQLSHLMLAVGILGTMIGSAGVYRSITDRGAAWAQVGFYGIVVGTVLWMITYAMTSVDASTAADWAAAPAADKNLFYGIAVASINVGKAAYIMSILLFWLALVFLGVGMARSKTYPGWLGWIGAALGTGMVAIVGVPQFMAGEVNTSYMLIFAGLALLTTVWFLVIGIWVARKAW
jgi:hypothetical protein